MTGSKNGAGSRAPPSKSSLARRSECSILVPTNMKAERSAEDEVVKIAQGLKILSVETRLRILRLLRERNLCVGALACRLGLTQGAVSQHLKVLHEAGLVTAERRGYYVHYRVNEDALVRLRERIDELLEFAGPLSNVEAGNLQGTEEETMRCGKREINYEEDRRVKPGECSLEQICESPGAEAPIPVHPRKAPTEP